MAIRRVRWALRTVALVVATTTATYGMATIAATPAHATVPAPTTSDPITFRNDAAKACPAGQICIGGRQVMVHSKIPIESGDFAGVQALQSDSEAAFRELHALDANDQRVYDWGQADVAGLMWGRLVNIITQDPASRTPAENGAYHWFQQVVQRYQIDSAQNAINEYNNWKSQECAYKPKAPAPPYDSGLGCNQLKDGNDPAVAAVAAGAKLPQISDFESWGAYEAASNLGSSSTSAADITAMVEGSAGMAAALAGTVGTSIRLAGTGVGAYSDAIGGSLGAALRVRMGKAEGEAATKIAERLASGLFEGGGLFAIVGIASVAVIVLAVVAIGLLVAQAILASEVPAKLQGVLDAANGSLPDLSAMLKDTSPNGSNLLFSLFTGQTEVNHPFAVRATPEPSWHGDLLRSQSQDTSVSPPVASGPVVASKAVSIQSWGNPGDPITAITPAGSTPTLTWLTDQGWYQQSIDGGKTWTTEATLRYVDWNGKPRRALLHGDQFIDETAAVNADSLACKDTSQCSSTPTLHMLDANGTPITMSFDPTFPVPATITDNSGGTYSAGGATTFTDPATDAHGQAVTYTWQFESRCTPNSLCLSPFDPATNQFDGAFHGNPAVTETGQSVSYTWPSAGTFHVRLTTTNGAGSAVADEDVVVGQGAQPTIAVGHTNFGPLTGPGTVTLTGCVTTASPFDSPTVIINWGDGTSDTAVVPTITFVLNGVVQPTGQPFVVQSGVPAGGGCSGTWSFVADHTYSSTSSTGYPVSLTAEIPTTGQQANVAAGTVTFLPTTLDASFVVTNNGSLFDQHSLPAFNEGDTANFEVKFNADPSLYGVSGVNIDWGQFNEYTAFVSSCTSAGCTYGQTLDTSHVFYNAPGHNENNETVFAPTLVVLGKDGNVLFQKTAPVAVFDVRPTISGLTFTPTATTGGFPSTPQGQLVTLSGTVSTPNPTTPLALTVTWPGAQDGSVDTINLPPSYSPNRTFTSTHLYRAYSDFVRNVEVDAYDDAGGQDIRTANLFVTNVAPSPSSTAATTAQGSPVSVGVVTGDPGLFDNFTQTIDWGDGSAPQTAGPSMATNGTLQTPPHTYVVPGTYNVSIALNDGNGGTGSTATTVLVQNVKPVAKLNPATGDRNTPVTLTGTITDPGTQDSFSGTVDWRDGSSPETFTLPAGSTALSLPHTYTQGGVYPAQVTVSDNHGGTGDAATGLISVNGPPVFKSDDPGDGVVGQDVGYQFGAKGLPQPTYAIADGALPPGLTLAGDGFLSGKPTATGTYTFKVSATNTSGSQTAGPITMTVLGVPAFTTDSPPGDALVGTPYSYAFTANGLPNPTFGIGSGAPPPGLNLDTASGVLSGTPTTTGSYTFALSATNSIGTTSSGTHTIVVKKSLTVTGPTVSRPFGIANPGLPAGYAGFLPGDSASSLTTAPTCSTAAGVSSLPGDYPVTCGGGVSSTYAFTYVPGHVIVYSFGGGSGSPPPPLPPSEVARIAGSDRIGTAVAASQDLFPTAHSSGGVVLARADRYPDTLAGAPLAVAHHAPVLLSDSAVLNPITRDEIARVAPPGGTVWIVGGTQAIGSAVESELRSLGFIVVRYGGADRYETALTVAHDGLGDPSTILLATGEDFPDGLSAGPAAAHVHGAVLLTTGAVLDPLSAAYVREHPSDHVFAIGGPAASAEPSATPIVGADRFDTATMVAHQFFTAPTVAGLATGRTFPDALAAAAEMGTLGGPLLLTDPDVASQPTIDYLRATPSIASLKLYGGPDAISPAVASAI